MEPRTLVTKAWHCFKATFQHKERSYSDCLSFLFKVEDAINQRGSRWASVVFTRHAMVNAGDFEAREHILCWNALRRGFDGKQLTFETVPEDPVKYLELKVRGDDVDQRKRPVPDDVIRSYLAAKAYFLGYKCNDDPEHHWVDLVAEEDLDYLGVGNGDLRRVAWRMGPQGEGFLRFAPAGSAGGLPTRELLSLFESAPEKLAPRGGAEFDTDNQPGAGGVHCGIVDSQFDKFRELIQPFRSLWDSVRVISLAVGPPMERKSVVTRIVLQSDEARGDQPLRKPVWLEPTHDVLIVALDFPKNEAAEVITKAIEQHSIDLSSGPKLDRVFLRWPLPPSSPEGTLSTVFSGFSWYEPFKHSEVWARNQFGEDKTCLALTGAGDRIDTLVSSQLWDQASSKLRQMPPDHFDGIEDFFEKYLPGIRYSIFDQRPVQIVFPIPLNMEQCHDGSLTLSAPKGAAKGNPTIIVHFKPQGPPLSLKPEKAEPPWRWEIAWPKGAASAKASLHYAEEEIRSIGLRRWPSATTIRAVVDSYFDPEHKRLRETLLGLGSKTGKKGNASEPFELACVRLMNLLGVPLVWYGGPWESSARNDGAGLVEKKEERVVVLAECTAERPEAKFSALQGRAQKLADSLQSEAKVLPVVFTQVDATESVLDSAREHGIALVGKEELNALLEMLSSVPASQDALGYLSKLLAVDPLKSFKFPSI